MSAPCPLREEILAPPALRQETPELLRAHLETCSECQSAASTLVELRGQLAEHAPVPRPGVEARILSELRAATARKQPRGVGPGWRSRTGLGLGLGLGVALSAAALLFFLSLPGTRPAVVADGSLAQLTRPEAPLLLVNDAVPLGVRLEARAAAQITTGIARLTLAPASELELRAAAPGRLQAAEVEEVLLNAGRVTAEVTPLRGGRSFAVRTEEATVTVVGTAFSVEREEGRTRIEVEHGIVRAVSRDGRRLLLLKAGDRAVFPPEDPANATRTESDDSPETAPAGAAARDDEATQVDPDSLAELATRARARRPTTERDRQASPRTRPAAAPAIQTPPIPTARPSAASGEPSLGAPTPPPARVTEADRPRVQRERLAEARRALRRTPADAIDLARGVLDRPSTETIEAEALAVLADGYRRSGRIDEAAALYARVAAHPAGAGLAEESLLQLALLRDRQGRRPEALSALTEAGRRFPEGMLAPERVALRVEMLADAGREGAAAQALLAAPRLHSLELERHRIRLAESVATTDPAAARALLSATRVESLPAAWDARHEAVWRLLEGTAATP